MLVIIFDYSIIFIECLKGLVNFKIIVLSLFVHPCVDGFKTDFTSAVLSFLVTVRIPVTKKPNFLYDI